MSAPVRIEAKAWSDPRYATLARILGYSDPDLALIKCARIWSWQTEAYTADHPTYVVDEDTIVSILGEGGPAALVRARLADETPEGYRMRGAEGRIEWCEDLTSKRQRAGRERAAKAKRDAAGRLLGGKNGSGDYGHPAHAGCAGPAPTSTSPAQSSAPAPDPSPDQRREREPQTAAGSAQLALVPDPAKQERRPRARQHAPKTRLPEGWRPSGDKANRDAEREAQQRGVNLEIELASLHDWVKAGGEPCSDWDARWRNWLRRARPQPGPASGGTWNPNTGIRKTTLL